jgi:uncharacterized protein YsxB (DUF464 family)
MIEIRFFKSGRDYYRIESRGHSGRRYPFKMMKLFLKKHAEFGNIVCSAVSILMYHLLIGIQKVEKLRIKRFEETQGTFILEVLRDRNLKRAQRYFQTLIYTLKNLEKKYHHMITLIEENTDVT